MAENIEDELEWLIDDDAEVPETSASQQDEKVDKPNTMGSEHLIGGTSDTDEEDDGLTPAEREILNRNTLLNDAYDRDDYDLKNKVERANADLERTDLDSDRETKVMFKRKLVDVEAPPFDYSSASSSSSDSEDEDKASGSVKKIPTDKKGSGDNKEILVEKGGKFQLMTETTHNQAHSSSSSSSSSDEEKKTTKHTPTKEPPQITVTTPRPSYTAPSRRPNSAPVSQTRTVSSASPRPGSASHSNEFSHIRSPYAMSPEMKELMRKRASARAAREEEEKAQEKAKEDENRQNAEYAWKCWLEKKDQEMKERKKLEDERKQKDEKYDTKKEADEAYQLWLSEKRKQTKKQRLQEQQRQLEVDEGWYRRDRKECDKAYKQWLRQKDREARDQRFYERKSGQQTRADVYRMKKLKRLLMSIQNSQRYSH